MIIPIILYVFSRSLKKSDPMVRRWENAVVIKNLAAVKTPKASKGADLHVWGSGELVQLLLKNDLVDECRLKIHPLTLGKGKKLFHKAPVPAAFAVTESVVTPGGVVIAAFIRTGKVKTGTADVKKNEEKDE